MQYQASRLTDQIRYELMLDPSLGAGNFLHRAHACNAARDEPLLFAQKPIELAAGDVRDAFSISDLKRLSDGYSAWYLAQGVAPMDPVGVYFDDSVRYLLHYVALTAIGAIPVLTNGAMDPETAIGHFRRIGTVGIVTDRPRHAYFADACGDLALRFLAKVEEIPAEDLPALPDWFPFRHDEEDPVMITHSSGTTGVPKAIVLQHGRWFHGIRHLLGLESAQGADRYLSSLPGSHNAAIAYAIHALLNGSALMMMTDRDGETVARAISEFRPATVVSFPQTYAELAELDPDAHGFDSVMLWINSGDAAHESHIRLLVERGYHDRGGERVQGSQFVDGLGSSEMGHSSFRIVHTQSTNTFGRCVGRPQSWVEAVVLGPDGKQVSPGTVGRLGVRSPSVTAGYWNDTLLTFRSRVGGYWLTGDLVYQDSFGCFYHVDRISDAIPTSDGPLYSLETEEAILARHPELADCTVIGVSDGPDGAQKAIVLAISRAEASPDSAALVEAINEQQAARGRPFVAGVRLVAREDVPLGVTGKVLKRVLRDRLELESRADVELA